MPSTFKATALTIAIAASLGAQALAAQTVIPIERPAPISRPLEPIDPEAFATLAAWFAAGRDHYCADMLENKLAELKAVAKKPVCATVEEEGTGDCLAWSDVGEDAIFAPVAD